MTTDRPLKPGDVVHIRAKARRAFSPVGMGTSWVFDVVFRGNGVGLAELPAANVVWQHAPEPDGEDGTAAQAAELRGIVDGIHLAVHGNDAARHKFPNGCPDLVIEVQELVRQRDPARMVMDLVAERDEARAKVAALEAERDRWRHRFEDQRDACMTVMQQLDEAQAQRDQAHRAMSVAEQSLGEALRHNVAEWYPGMPRLVEQVVGLVASEEEALAEVDRLKAAAANGAGAEVLEMNGALLAKVATLQGEVNEARRLRKVEFDRANRNAAEMCRLMNELDRLSELRDAALAWLAGRLVEGPGERNIADARFAGAVDAYRAGQATPTDGPAATLPAQHGADKAVETPTAQRGSEAVCEYGGQCKPGECSGPCGNGEPMPDRDWEAEIAATIKHFGYTVTHPGRWSPPDPVAGLARCIAQALNLVDLEREIYVLQHSESHDVVEALSQRDTARRKLKRARKALATITYNLGMGRDLKPAEAAEAVDAYCKELQASCVAAMDARDKALAKIREALGDGA